MAGISRASPTRRVAATAFVGGALVCAGAALPWMSFLAGLQSLSGLVGLYGRILFASGAFAIVAGAAMLRRSSVLLPVATGALGVLQTLFVLWLLLGLHATLQGMGMHAMLVPRAGPGLLVSLGGAMFTMIAPFGAKR